MHTNYIMDNMHHIFCFHSYLLACNFLVFFMTLGVVLMLNILPVQTGLAGKQAQCEAIHAQAKGLPVVFDGSFQMPSLYRFFYDDQAVLVRNQYDRYTQYDLLHLERGLIGRPACVHRFGQVYITDQLTEQDLHE